MNNIENQKALGWSDQLNKTINITTSNPIGRIIAVDRELFTISIGEESFKAKLSGSFIYKSDNSLNYPCVGDWVFFNKKDMDDFAMIKSIIDRKTVFKRKVAGKKSDIQMIASNIDYVVIVQSCHYDFNIKRLERYLVMVTGGGAKPRILLTKTDLVTSDDLEAIINDIKSSGISAPIETISNVTGEGVEQFKSSLLPTKTYCFVGSSGVGKSTLINGLIGKQDQCTQSVSNTGEGRHTTVRRELIMLSNGAIVIDNPGIRELAILNADDGMDLNYFDIEEISSQCKFKNCTHNSEPGCAVLEALETGDISDSHFNNYLKLKAEAEFNDMSYLEKRQKDKNFGKYIKKVKKGIKRTKGRY